MSEHEMLGAAIIVAAQAHMGQLDKGGKPYILHPLHLMNQLMYDPELAQIAVMHDIIEDSSWTSKALHNMKFSQRVVAGVVALTHRSGESYDDYIKRIALNIDAILVKRKDLEHNSCITRLKGVTSKDVTRMQKYHKAFLFLGEARSNHRGW